MPTEGLEPPLSDYKTETLPLKRNRLRFKNNKRTKGIKYLSLSAFILLVLNNKNWAFIF
jgi:hypothetical protein